MTIPWYYMWSDDYRFFHEIFKESMKEPEFTVQPIEISQDRFDTDLYQIEDKHHWEGSMIRVDSILECLIGESEPYIVFTDIGIVVKPGIHKELKSYIDAEYDMVFLKNESIYSVGFILLRRSKAVIDFWKKVHERIVHNIQRDQVCVNELLPSFPGKYTSFNDKTFTSSISWNQESQFTVMQIHSSLLGKGFNIAEKIFNMAQHIDIESYMQYVKDNIVSYIYRFQDVLFQSHKEARESALNS